NSTRSFYVLFMIVPMLVFISIQGVIRGYLSGAGFLSSSLYSNLILIVMSYVLSIVFSRIAYNYGIKINALMHVDDIACVYGAIGATLGISASCFISLIFILIMYLVHRGELKALTDKSIPEKNGRNWKCSADIIPSCLLFAQGGFLLFLDECIYLSAANRIHPGENNIENWGLYVGQCISLSVILIFISGLPFLKSWYGIHYGIVKKDFKVVKSRITDLIHFESMLIFPMVLWVMILAGTITNIVFGKTTDAAVNMIVLTVPIAMPGAFLIFHMFLLLHLKNNLLVAVNSVMGIVVHLVAVIIMTFAAGLGIHASMGAFFLSAIAIVILGIFEVKIMFDLKSDIFRIVLKPLLAAGISSVLCLLIDRLLVNLIGEVLTFIIAIIISYLAYMVLLIVLKAVNRYEVERMPFGDYFALLVDRIEKR
nr:oligosaccharide flippase family protein [Butyrivibrio sp.]